MDRAIEKYRAAGEIVSLNINDLDVEELERRLEMSIAAAEIEACISNKNCSCSALSSCGQYCG